MNFLKTLLELLVGNTTRQDTRQRQEERTWCLRRATRTVQLRHTADHGQLPPTQAAAGRRTGSSWHRPAACSKARSGQQLLQPSLEDFSLGGWARHLFLLFTHVQLGAFTHSPGKQLCPRVCAGTRPKQKVWKNKEQNPGERCGPRSAARAEPRRRLSPRSRRRPRAEDAPDSRRSLPAQPRALREQRRCLGVRERRPRSLPRGAPCQLCALWEAVLRFLGCVERQQGSVELNHASWVTSFPSVPEPPALGLGVSEQPCFGESEEEEEERHSLPTESYSWGTQAAKPGDHLSQGPGWPRGSHTCIDGTLQARGATGHNSWSRTSSNRACSTA